MEAVEGMGFGNRESMVSSFNVLQPSEAANSLHHLASERSCRVQAVFPEYYVLEQQIP